MRIRIPRSGHDLLGEDDDGATLTALAVAPRKRSATFESECDHTTVRSLLASFRPTAM